MVSIHGGAQLISDVLEGKFKGISFEGIVGKATKNGEIAMAKAKTQVWKDKVRVMYDADIAQKLLES